MMPSALTLCRALAPGALSARLLHTLFVFCATSLMLSIAVYSFLLILLLKSVPPAPASRRAGRHVTFRERPSIVPPLPAAVLAARARTSSPSRKATATAAASARPLSLLLTPTPGAFELEPQTPDVTEDPLRALSRICAFLASNTARAWRGEEELERTPPLAGLEPYLDAVREDLARIDEMVADRGDSEGEGKEREEDQDQDQEAVAVAVAVMGAEVKDRESAGEDQEGDDAAGAADADADANDEPGLVNPDQATAHAHHPPTPPSQFPTLPLPPDTPPSIPTSTSESASTPPLQPEPTNTTTTIQTPPNPAITETKATPSPRKRKDAVLRTTNPKKASDAADADDAAVRAAALFSRVADLGTGLFREGTGGTVRERGAALLAALSRRSGGAPSSSSDAGASVPVRTPLPRFAGPAEQR